MPPPAVPQPAYRLNAATGMHRGDRQYQQDQVEFIAHTRVPGCALAVLADRMGGKSSGRKAAAVAIARANLGHVKTVDIKKGDARRLDVEPGRVTLFLANLPFGKQFGTTDSNPTLYRKILADALRIGVPGRWQGIYLTSDDESFRTASREVPGLNVESLFQVKVRGEPATAYRVTPTGH